MKLVSSRGRLPALLCGLAVVAAACGSSSTKSSTPTTTGSTGTSGSGSSATTAAGGAQPTGTPLAIGSIQQETSSAAAGTNTEAADALKAWVSYTNAHGGVVGHPVKLTIIDDKGDPATGLAAAQKLVQQDHVIAIVGQTAGVTDFAWANYVKAQKVPVIGGSQIDNLWFTNPMFYPVGSDVIANIWGQMKSAAVQGVKKVGVILCTESTACAQAQALFKADAKAVGMDPVYVTLASQTAPSYTAQCLAAKQAGAEALAAFVNDTLLARNCTAQGYNPKWINADEGPTPSTITAVPALGNAVGSSEHWNCLGPSTPATQPYNDAMAQYAPQWLKGGSKYGISTNSDCSSWDAAEGFALAVQRANIPAGSTATSADVIRGLSTFHNTPIGSYSPPMTYGNGTTPNPIANCTYLYKWQGTTFIPVPSTTGYTCMPPTT